MRAISRLAFCCAVLYALVSAAGETPRPTLALFGDAQPVGSNTFSTTSLGPPGTLTGITYCANGKPKVDLDWGPATSGGTPEYNVYRSATFNNKYGAIATTTALSHQDGGVQKSTTYWYKVESKIGGWTGGFSNEISVLTPDICL